MRFINPNAKTKAMTVERLKEVLNYDPDTGIFTRLVRTTNSSHVGDKVGWSDDHGYLKVMVDRAQHFIHRLAWLYMTGLHPVDQIDHVNGNRTDNRWDNLRAVSNLENSRNQSLAKNNTSGYIGVYWRKQRSKWGVRITVNKKTINLGLFEDISSAVKARKIAEIKYGFHSNHGRVKA